MKALRGRSTVTTFGLISLGALILLGSLACSQGPQQAAVDNPAASNPAATVQPAQPGSSASATGSVSSLKLLETTPEQGPAGTKFTVTGSGLKPGTQVDLEWVTQSGGYHTESSITDVEFYKYVFTTKRIVLGHAAVDAQGVLSAEFSAPEDFGGVHDLYITAAGQDLAKGGFNLLRTATITPDQGPVGTPITITVKGMGSATMENTSSIRYDNAYTGEVSAITTSGTAVFQIRASGSVGPHVIQINDAAHSTPYLNLQQSPYADVPMDYTFVFNVTGDSAVPPDTMDWPAAGAVVQPKNVSAVTTADNPSPAGVSAVLKPPAGPILSQAVLSAQGLPSGVGVDLLWTTVRGNRSAQNGWELKTQKVGGGTTGADGSLQADVQVPDDLGGWHVIKVVRNGSVLAEAPFFLQQSLIDVSPGQVKEGQTFTIHLKGIGWTELDNTVAVTYDNQYIGFACGFNSNGDVQIPLVATGGPGPHLIDIYPTTYQGHGESPWTYQVPILTALSDGPGLGLGYDLPVFRLAIQVVP